MAHTKQSALSRAAFDSNIPRHIQDSVAALEQRHLEGEYDKTLSIVRLKIWSSLNTQLGLAELCKR